MGLVKLSKFFQKGERGGFRGVEFSKLSQKGGRVQIFSTEREGLVKYGIVFKKKVRGVLLSLIFILSNRFQSESEWWFVFFLYTVSISILCVLWEEPSLIESSQQICDFYKSVTFKKQRHNSTK